LWGSPMTLSLDHDLGSKLTGYDAARYVEVKFKIEPFEGLDIMCHSMNPDGRARINSVIERMNLWRR